MFQTSILDVKRNHKPVAYRLCTYIYIHIQYIQYISSTYIYTIIFRYTYLATYRSPVPIGDFPMFFKCAPPGAATCQVQSDLLESSVVALREDPASPWMVKILEIVGQTSNQLVHDFFHPRYVIYLA